MAPLMQLLLLVAPLILTSNAESGQKVIQFKILRFHQDNVSLTFPQLNVVALIFSPGYFILRRIRAFDT